MFRRHVIAVWALIAPLLVCDRIFGQWLASPAGDAVQDRCAQLEREMVQMQLELDSLRERVSSLAAGNATASPAMASMFGENTVNPAMHLLPDPGVTETAAPAELPSPDAGRSVTISKEEFDALMSRIETLEQNQTPKLPSITGSEAGWIDISDEKWNVRIGGHIQTDYIMWPYKDPDITSPLARNYFEFRRLRLDANGTGYGVFGFRLQMTLEPETVAGDPTPIYLPTVRDAYFNINDTPVLGRVRLGNYFVPFSLEQVTNDTNTVFLERSIPSQGTFTGGREVGIAQYNHSDSENFSWTTGFFFDDITDTGVERIDSNQGYRVSGRLVYLPYYDEPSHGRYMVHTGVGVLYTHTYDHEARFRARPQIHTGPFLIDTGPIPSDHFTIGNIEMATVWGPLCLQSELFYCDVDVRGEGSKPLYGAYFYGTYFLTGENRNYERFGQHGAQFGRPKIYQNVFWVPGAHSCGAWEFKARWSYLDFDSVGSGQYNDLTVGFNWYWSDRVRMLFDWIRPVTTGGAVYGATQSDIIGMRLDCNW